MAVILNFKIFLQKLQNTKMLISRKPCENMPFRQFFLPTGYLQSSHPNFQQIRVSSKMAASLNVWKNCNTQKCLYHENGAR